MKNKRFVSSVVLLLIGFAAVSLSSARAPIRPVILFAVNYENHAWGNRVAGYYVESDGYIYSYEDNGKEWSPKETPSSSKDLHKRYSSARRQIGKVDPDTLRDKSQLILGANQGILSQRKDSTCFDCGTTTYLAFTHYDDNKTDVPIILGQYNFAGTLQENSSGSAASLIAWLRTLRHS